MVQHGAPDLAAGCSEGGIPVGARVRCGGRFATVRWVGQLRGRAGEWCGLEWDEPGQGKHDGALDNYQYFTCSSSAPDCASFVRPQKLDALVTCAQAIHAYYGEQADESTAALHKAVIDEWKRKIKVPFIEMVGFDSVQKKQGTLNALLEACVSDKCISSSGDLGSLCPNLRILDISKNLLVDWYSVVEITSQLVHLMNLNLSKNRLVTPSSDKEADELSPHFDGLQKINVAYCNIEWNDFVRICRMWRHIEEIILAYNRISIITPPSPDTFSDKLTTLVLDGNPLNSWREVLNIGTLKNLSDLSVNDCKLEHIVFDDTYHGEKTNLFVKLKELHIKQNLIKDWRSISELNKLKSLSKLYVAKNPLLLLENYDTSSQLIIARIENLKELNGSEVSREIRRGAEYDYMKKHGLLWKQSKDSNDENIVMEFGLFHSRFDQLIQKYGLPDENLLATKKETWAISTNLIEVFLKDDSTGLTVKKKVPITMSVQKLIALTRRVFSPKVNAARTSTCPTLCCVQMNKLKQNTVLVPLDNQMKELDFFSVSDGDTIIVKW